MDICKIIYDGKKIYSVDNQNEKVRNRDAAICINNHKFVWNFIHSETKYMYLRKIHDVIRTLTRVIKYVKRGYMFSNIDRFID